MPQLNKKKQNDIIDLIDNMLDEGNPFNDTIKKEPEDIFIDDDLFDNTDQKEIKKVSEESSKTQTWTRMMSYSKIYL